MGEEDRRSLGRIPSFTSFRDFQERGRLPQTPKDDVPKNICVVDMEFIDRHQPSEYIAQLPYPDECIIQLTLGTSQCYFKITTLICMYVMRYSFSLQGFVRDMFNYYWLGPGQLHPNRWTIVSSLKIFCRMVGLKPMINFFRCCYQLVTDIDGNNDVLWFFTFFNKSNGAMKNTLTVKPISVKK